MAFRALFPQEVHIESMVGGGSRLTLPKRWALLALPVIVLVIGTWLFMARDVFIGQSSLVNEILRVLRAKPLGLGSLIFLAAWLAAWILFGIWVLAALVWLVAGRERVSVEQGTLTLEQVVGSVGRRRRYDLQQVTGLRTLSLAPRARTEGVVMPFGFASGSLAFDYGSRMVRWGGGLSEDDERTVIEWLGQLGVSRTAQPDRA